MNTSKKGIRLIAEICKRKGIRKVVFSPGSRSAPLVMAFSQIPDIECLVIPDERVAGYFALGMAQQLAETVAVVCTSGTAVLNLAPAVCEAFFQNIPLLVLTADRPEGAANNGENQAIMQDSIFGNHTLSKYSIDGEGESKRELDELITTISDAIDDTNRGYIGPVHVNIHIDEPLYETTDEKLPADIGARESKPMGKEFIPLKDLQRIKNEFSYYKKKMLLVGMREYDEEFIELLEVLNKREDLIVVHENLSNLPLKDAVWNTDACLELISDRNGKQYIPDVVITLGRQIISKKIKKFLNGMPKLHWDVPPGSSWGRGWAMFGDMFDPIEPVNEMQFLNAITETEEAEDTNYKKLWLDLSNRAATLSDQYFAQVEFSDLIVFEVLQRNVPFNTNVQYGNSTPVRYANFFKPNNSLTVNANRGTSGIDGCLSTAAGAAYVNDKPTVCVIGDVSFFYDSNALWNNYLSPNLKIIVINNSGGNIFRLIDGPNKVNDFEKFFETKHHLDAKNLATMYGLPYYFCDQEKGFENVVKNFLDEKSFKASILEIKTNGEVSADVYKKYFQFLKKNSDQTAQSF